MPSPLLSICVPSRNRQLYFQETIRALVASPRDDIELVFADNSEDGREMQDFMQAYQDDSRVKFLPATGATLSMVDNWERTVAATTGQWVCVIGDDDYLDPEIAGVIARILQTRPQADAISWNRMAWNWPGTRPWSAPVAVPIGDRIVDVPREVLMRRMFGWEKASFVPECLFSIYHACIRRDLLERIRKTYGNRYFEHPTVDFDSSFKILNQARCFISIERPFSVLGACPASNSAAIGRLADMRNKHAMFMADLGRDMDKDDFMHDFPFPTTLGVTASIVAAQQWFKVTYGFKYKGWEENFAKACERSCTASENEEVFEFYRDGYREAFAIWKNGRFAKAFNPVFAPPPKTVLFTGVRDRLVFVEEFIGGVKTPAEFYNLVRDMTIRSEDMAMEIVNLSAAA